MRPISAPRARTRRLATHRRRVLVLAALAGAVLATGGCGRLFVGAQGGSASDTDWTVGLEL